MHLPRILLLPAPIQAFSHRARLRGEKSGRQDGDGRSGNQNGVAEEAHIHVLHRQVVNVDTFNVSVGYIPRTKMSWGLCERWSMELKRCQRLTVDCKHGNLISPASRRRRASSSQLLPFGRELGETHELLRHSTHRLQLSGLVLFTVSLCHFPSSFRRLLPKVGSCRATAPSLIRQFHAALAHRQNPQIHRRMQVHVSVPSSLPPTAPHQKPALFATSREKYWRWTPLFGWWDLTPVLNRTPLR